MPQGEATPGAREAPGVLDPPEEELELPDAGCVLPVDGVDVPD